MNQYNVPEPRRFFREKSGAGATVVSVLLLILLTLGLIGGFAVHTVASIFEQRGLQRAMEAFLQSDEVRNEMATTIRDTFPDDVITDTQLDALITDDAIMEAVGQCVYDAIHFDMESPVDFYDQVFDTINAPESAPLYGEALDHFIEILGVDSETYLNTVEAIAEELQIPLPEGEPDKLTLTSAILQTTIDNNRDKLPQITTDALLTNENSGTVQLISAAQKALILFETPKFILYNLLVLAVWYGLILLIKRNYRKPFLYCCIPYFLVGIMMLAAAGLLSLVISMISVPDFSSTLVVDIASAPLLRSGIIAFCFAIPLLAAFIVLTILKRKRASAGPVYEPTPTGYDDSTAQGTEYDYAAAQGTGYDYSATQGTEYDYAAAQGTGYDYAATQGTEYDYSATQGTGYDDSTAQGTEYDYSTTQGTDQYPPQQ